MTIGVEYPNFVCSACEDNLNHYALFATQIEKNTENWEIFLKNGGDVKDYGEFNPMTVRIEEIKIEFCDDSFDNVPSETDTNVYDALETSFVKVEMDNNVVSQENINAKGRPRKRKFEYSDQKPLFVTVSTEYERTCRLCDEHPTFPSLARFYKHQHEHHPHEKSFICDICGSKFNNKTRLAAHMKDRHAKWGKKHQCQFCAKLFYSDREVKGHERLHVNARSYVCNLCGKGFNQKTVLNIHLRSKAHNVDYKTIKAKKRPPGSHRYKFNAKKVFRCQLCVPTSVFSSPEERTAHRNEVHRKFECNICKNSFMAQESLDSHKLLHSDKPRPFVCTVSSHLIYQIATSNVIRVLVSGMQRNIQSIFSPVIALQTKAY